MVRPCLNNTSLDNAPDVVNPHFIYPPHPHTHHRKTAPGTNSSWASSSCLTNDEQSKQPTGSDGPTLQFNQAAVRNDQPIISEELSNCPIVSVGSNQPTTVEEQNQTTGPEGQSDQVRFIN